MQIFINLVFFAYLNSSTEAKLRLLSVVFRHGDRTPDVGFSKVYTKDPYKNQAFFPTGGHLTNDGKNRMYNLGRFLRKEYDDFLGPYYYPGELDARSTFIERTKVSLQLVLKGLYLPKGKQKWNENLNQQLIPVRFLNHLDDVLMNPQSCPRFLKYLSRVTRSSEYRAQLKNFYPLMCNLTTATGTPVQNAIDMASLYTNMMDLTSMNIPLPEWSEGIFPIGQLYDGYVLELDYMSFNDELIRLHGGMLLRKMIDDMTNACSGKLDRKRKVFFYSGHDNNVVAVLKAMNIYKPQNVRFSAAVVVELHEENHKCFVKVKHYKGIVDKLTPGPMYEELKVPGCNTGYLAEFKSVLLNHIPTDDDINSCDKRLIPKSLKEYGNVPKSIIDAVVKDVKAEKMEKEKLS